MKTFSWKNEPELMARLTKAQNHLKTPIDIMTCVGFFDSREQLTRHVECYEAQAGIAKPIVMAA